MSERSAYFNGRLWRQLLGNNEQAVRFLEELWLRTGAGQPPDINLDQVVNEITQIDNSVRSLGVSLNSVRRVASDAAAEASKQNLGAMAQMHDIQRRLSQLESETAALRNLEHRIKQYIAEGIQLHVKPLEKRINQLEDAQ